MLGIVELKVHEAEPVPLGAKLTAVDGHVTVKPAAGLTRELRLTEPAKLKVLRRVADMEAPAAPELKLAELLTEITKSPT